MHSTFFFVDSVKHSKMNHQTGSKKVLFSRSSLINLKAELLKKQEEVKKMKALPQHKIENYKPPLPKPSDEDENVRTSKKTFKDSLQAVDTDELEACKKAKSVLEKKAALYEHLSNPVGESKLAGNFLVDFAAKKQETSKPDKVTAEQNIDNFDDDDSEWAEFTDCLGRTRKCLRADLELYIMKDRELQRNMDKEQLGGDYVAEKEFPQAEKPFLVQKTNDYLHSLREKWEVKEQELLAKDRDIHYQDVLFDEARMHGVSYYSFSTDENERKKQMDELMRVREETLRAQKQAEEKRRQKDDLVAARLKAAKARQRLRAGLPPEDPEENQKDFNACLLEFLNKQREEAEERAKENERQIKEQIEKERQKLREAYVRDWDRGKTGVSEKPKFKEMTQEEYVEQQRDKRINEFAPTSSTSTKKSIYTFDDRGNMTDERTTKTWDDVRPKPKSSAPPDISCFEDSKGLYFSSKTSGQSSTITSDTNYLSVDNMTNIEKPKTPPPPIISFNATNEMEDKYKRSSFKNNMKYKNYFVSQQEPTPIVNELSDDDEEYGVTEERQSEASHAEIAPPPTYDYYGPVPKKARTQIPFKSDIREAFDQGQKSLETKPGNHRVTKNYDFTFV